MSFSGGLAIVGGFTVFFHLLKLTWRCWCGFKAFVLSEVWQVDLKIYGQWAVVTGATSGIGKAYAHELAQRGLDVVLISRSNDKLEMAAKEIETKYGRKVRTIQTDFTHGHSIYPAIAEGLKGLEIGVLVNNVGMAYSENFDYFLEVPNSEEKITHVINCNMLSVAQMTRLVLPDMVERGTGLIINIASGVGVRPQPLLTLYSATKSFVTYFSQGLHAEYKSRGITVQCVSPLIVSTNMTYHIQHSTMNRFMKSAPDFAREALNTVGHSSYTSGCLSHALQSVALTTLLPDWFRLSSFCIRKMEDFAKLSKKPLKTEKLKGKDD
ncbi:hydroxysteroid (20-beta) dehydrogenase 2 [Myripristis murdjan]|uniref:hydroxysteroid (20-beta) dehydrogenase 2 n=1 Tax=Myripristis murdjan TaxID=586833 RepID=UPI0011763CC7|nr:very-long-chain 3-oxoacyl-CoA reductase-like [Myripristis murdjan]